MTEWQPIETAPKEERVLVYIPDGDPNKVFICEQIYEYGDWEAGREGFWFWDMEDDYIRPTHWMPLPELPWSVPQRGVEECS